jgi:hypothetical protein
MPFAKLFRRSYVCASQQRGVLRFWGGQLLAAGASLFNLLLLFLLQRGKIMIDTLGRNKAAASNGILLGHRDRLN